MRGKADRWDNDAKANERARTRDRDNWPNQVRPRRSHATQTRAASNVHAPHIHTYHTQTNTRRSGWYYVRSRTSRRAARSRLNSASSAASTPAAPPPAPPCAPWATCGLSAHIRSKHAAEHLLLDRQWRGRWRRRQRWRRQLERPAAPAAGGPERGVATAACARRIDARSSARVFRSRRLAEPVPPRRRRRPHCWATPRHCGCARRQCPRRPCSSRTTRRSACCSFRVARRAASAACRSTKAASGYETDQTTGRAANAEALVGGVAAADVNDAAPRPSRRPSRSLSDGGHGMAVAALPPRGVKPSTHERHPGLKP